MKVLEVNNVDIFGKSFNGYDMISDLSGDNIDIKQCVIFKNSDNDKVVKILNNDAFMEVFYKFQGMESELSVKNVFSITSSCLMNLDEYRKADIIHFHMFHNTELSLFSLIEISREKKVILSLHDPWIFTGHCVHFFECNKWMNGCKKCNNLSSMFPIREDNCNNMWSYKKKVFENIDIDLVVSSDWMRDLAVTSKITSKQKIHKIALGTDYLKFQKISHEEARKHYDISTDIVLFLRAGNEFKGTSYVVEALRKLDTDKSITVITCDKVGLLDEVKDKYKVIDLGSVPEEEIIYVMNACDIFLMPSIGESFGAMAVEAMSCGKTVVVFDNTALPSVTHAPECGYLVKNKDSDDLCLAIKTLIENEEERLRRGKLGKKIVEKEYSKENCNKKIIKLYEEVYKRKKSIVDVNYKENKYNDDQVKILLNSVTARIFGPRSKSFKKLKYNVDSKYDSTYKIDFSLLSSLKILDLYEKNLYEELKYYDNGLPHDIITKVSKALYLLIHNYKGLKIYKKGG